MAYRPSSKGQATERNGMSSMTVYLVGEYSLRLLIARLILVGVAAVFSLMGLELN